MTCHYKNSQNLKACNNFRLESISYLYCATTGLNTGALICLTVKWVGWVRLCVGTMGWVWLGHQAGGSVWVM